MIFPTIISFYTKNTGYETEANFLKKSCEKLNLSYEIEPIDSFGSWEKNCCYKPLFIKQKLQKLNGPVLWVDADGMMLKKPLLLDRLHCDTAVPLNDKKTQDDPAYLFSATLFFTPEKKSLQLIDLWIDSCEQRQQVKGKKDVWIDQQTLRDIILENKVNATIERLPRSYWHIYNSAEEESEEQAVILHYQASRVLRKEIDKLTLPPYLEQAKNEYQTLRTFHRLHILYQLETAHAPHYR